MIGIERSLRFKLLLFWLGSIFSVLILVGMVYLYLQSSRLENISFDRIDNSFSILNDKIETRKNTLHNHINKIASRGSNLSNISMIDTYQNIENYEKLIFDL